MKPALTLLAALLMAPLAASAQQSTATVRDRLWIFTVYAGGNNRETQEKHYIDDYAPGGSRMTPAEGAFWLGVPNLLLIRAKDIPPLPSTEAARAKTTFEQYAISFQPLDRVVWSVVGGGGEGGMNELPPVLDLAKKYPNIRGVFLDDFVRPDKRVNGRMVGRPSLQREDLRHAREQMKAVGRPMEVWVTLYTHEINESRKTAAPTYRGCEPPLASFLDQFDVLTLWTWNSDELRELGREPRRAGEDRAEESPHRPGPLHLGFPQQETRAGGPDEAPVRLGPEVAEGRPHQRHDLPGQHRARRRHAQRRVLPAVDQEAR